jgi:hypothetical protein
MNGATPTVSTLDALNLASTSVDAHVIGRKSNDQSTFVRLV